MKGFIRVTASAALIAAIVVAGTAGPVAAQLDPGNFDIYQRTERGRWLLSGQIFVPSKANPQDYVEHWVLFPRYTYPSGTTKVATRIIPSKDQSIRTASQFFSQRFPDGSRYVEVTARESDTVPIPSTRASAGVMPAATDDPWKPAPYVWLAGAACLAAYLAAAAMDQGLRLERKIR